MNGIKYAATASKTTGGMVVGLVIYMVYEMARTSVPSLSTLPDGGVWLPAILVGGPAVKETARNIRAS